MYGKEQDGQEFGVGICQWTVVGGNDYLSGFLNGIYKKDSSFCSVLQPFLNYTAAQYFENHDDLKEAFTEMSEVDKDYLIQLEMEYAIEEKSNVVKQYGYAWLLDRPGAVVGTVFSLINYGPGNFTEGMEAKGITEDMSDEEIIMRICAFEASMNGTAGAVYGPRSESQARVAIDILHGKVDAEKFVRKGITGSFLKYANGANPGYLNGY